MSLYRQVLHRSYSELKKLIHIESSKPNENDVNLIGCCKLGVTHHFHCFFSQTLKQVSVSLRWHQSMLKIVSETDAILTNVLGAQPDSHWEVHGYIPFQAPPLHLQYSSCPLIYISRSAPGRPTYLWNQLPGSLHKAIHISHSLTLLHSLATLRTHHSSSPLLSSIILYLFHSRLNTHFATNYSTRLPIISHPCTRRTSRTSRLFIGFFVLVFSATTF